MNELQPSSIFAELGRMFTVLGRVFTDHEVQDAFDAFMDRVRPVVERETKVLTRDGTSTAHLLTEGDTSE